MIFNAEGVKIHIERDPLTGNTKVAIPFGPSKECEYVVLEIREHHHVTAGFGYWVKKNKHDLRREVLTDLHNQLSQQLAILALED